MKAFFLWLSGSVAMAQFVATPNYHAGASNSVAAIYSDTVSPDATMIVQRISDVYVPQSYNASIYVSHDMRATSGANNSAVSLFAETVSHGGLGTFVEGVRGHSVLRESVDGIASGYGGVFMAGTSSGIAAQFLVGVEGSLFGNTGVSAPSSFNKNSFRAAFVATSGTSDQPDAAYVVNPWNASPFRVGFLVAEQSADFSAFSSRAATVVGVDLSSGSQSWASVFMPNSSPIRAKATSGAGLNVLYLDPASKLQLGVEATRTVLHKPAMFSVPVFGSNAAALSGGLSVGDLYRQGDFLCIVR